MRSGIALMGFGVLIVRMRMLNMPMATHVPGNGWKLGLAFSIVGLLGVLLSTQHYFAVRNDIKQDTYEPPDRWVILSSLVVLLLGLGFVCYIFSFPTQLTSSVILE